MTLQDFLKLCQFHVDVAVYADQLLIEVNSAYCLLHSESPGILSRYDTFIDYITVCNDLIIVVLPC